MSGLLILVKISLRFIADGKTATAISRQYRDFCLHSRGIAEVLVTVSLSNFVCHHTTLACRWYSAERPIISQAPGNCTFRPFVSNCSPLDARPQDVSPLDVSCLFS